MINLSELKRENYKIIWLDGDVLEIRQPKQNLFEKLAKMASYYKSMMGEIEQLQDDDDVEKILEELDDMMSVVYGLLFDIFNNNTNKKKISREEIEDSFDLNTAFEVITDYLSFTYKDLGE